MGAAENWVDLLDPTPAELESHLPASIHSRALEQLLAPARHEDDPRPKLEAHGDYIFGVFLIAVAVPEEDLTGFREGDVLGRHVGEAFGLSGFESGHDPIALSLEYGVRRLNERLRLRARAGIEKKVVVDVFPALDDDGGLLVALAAA